jgi:molybdopterin-guanine dinucleotide biosynthesis protein A
MGRPKGLLRGAEGTTLIERWAALFAGLHLPCVLVGRRQAYAHLGLPSLEDPPGEAGPLGGLVALLRMANVDPGLDQVIVVACDMPRVSSALVRRLLTAPPATAVAPRSGGHWHSFFVRLHAQRALPVAARRLATGAHSIQGLLDELSTHELPISEAERAELIDWDHPEEVGS